MTGDGAITAEAFAALMAPFAPFEPAPRLAVAVSGGADSLALTLLADAWARSRGGSVLALTVDHGLRPESAAEAAGVAAQLTARGTAHAVLPWQGPKPAADIQAAAREARYRLLREACAARGILHLLTAHHRDDQAETLLLRLARGSGLYGLSGMAAESYLPEVRLLRPLLPVPKATLVATCRAAGLGWVDDPGNSGDRHARSRLRSLLPLLAAEGLAAERLAAPAGRLGRARAAQEAAAAALLAGAVELHPLGFAWIDPAAVAAAVEETGLRALAGVLACIGGSGHPPRLESLERAFGRLGSDELTVAGCRIVRRAGRWLVCREAGRAAPPVGLAAGEWDGRWRWSPGTAEADGIRLGAVGQAGLAAVAREARQGLPAVVVEALPALWRQGALLAVPPLGVGGEASSASCPSLRFAPRVAMTYLGGGSLRGLRHHLCMQV
ncbi:tRNA lysidine(34) synthetase TilS [Caenispirillum bisanense]|uniref:tRNA lysidine(34) synthetase TilS n=1 Tax=Caenispirillum bisanense TaxID=414052 RepID=UPI0031E14A80